VTKLTIRERGPISGNSQYADALLQTGAISVDQDAYSTDPDSTVLDRVYAAKGLDNMHVEIKNTGSTNALTYKIEKARKEFKLLSSLVEADFDQEIKANTDVLAGVKAFGSVTCATVLATQNVTFNGLLYTGVAGVKANNTEFSVDTGDDETATDLADSISQDTRAGTLDDLTAVAITNVVTAASTVIGTRGNAITLVSSNGTTLAVSGATFAGGVDNISIVDIVDISPESTAIRIKVRRKTAGQTTTLAGIVSVN